MVISVEIELEKGRVYAIAPYVSRGPLEEESKAKKNPFAISSLVKKLIFLIAIRVNSAVNSL